MHLMYHLDEDGKRVYTLKASTYTKVLTACLPIAKLKLGENKIGGTYTEVRIIFISPKPSRRN